jgi:ribonuclease III
MSVIPNIKFLQKKLDYHFSDEGYLQLALTHRSASAKHNERLEYLGDAVLGNVIAHQLYLLFPKANEGELSRLRSVLVKEKALFELAQELEIGDYIKLGGGELKSGGFRRASILSDTLEAIIGAVYLDSDFEKVQNFLLNIYKRKLTELSLDMAKKDPKTRLQEWLQSRNINIPDYEVVRSSGKDHAKIYWVSCKIKYKSLSSEGQGASRRKAEQNAAEKILEKLKIDN